MEVSTTGTGAALPTTILPPSEPGEPSSSAIGNPLTAIFNRAPPTLLMLLSLVAVQLGSALATALFSNLGPAGTALASTSFAALTLSLVARPKLDRRLRKHAWMVLAFGVALAAMLLPFFIALQFIPLALASTIAFLGPLALAVITSRRLVQFLWIGLAVIGVGLLAPDIGDEVDPIGLSLAGISAVGWAAFVLASKSAGRIFDGVSGLTFALWAAALMLVPFALIEGSFYDATALNLIGAFAVALLTTVLPLAMEYHALRRLSARAYGILVTLEPAIGAVVGAAFLAQPITLRMAAAIACVTAAAIGVTLLERQDRN